MSNAVLSNKQTSHRGSDAAILVDGFVDALHWASLDRALVPRRGEKILRLRFPCRGVVVTIGGNKLGRGSGALLWRMSPPVWGVEGKASRTPHRQCASQVFL